MDWRSESPGWLGSLDDHLFGYLDLMDWNINFGKCAECRSYAISIRQVQHASLGCGSSDTVIQTVGEVSYNYFPQLPPGVLRDGGTTCCGNCSLEIPEVKLYYFPDQTTTSCQNNQPLNITSILPSDNLNKRVHSLVASGNTAIVSGNTL